MIGKPRYLNVAGLSVICNPMWQPPEGSFSVQPIGFKPWSTPDVKPIEPAWRSDEGLKRAFGIELVKHPKPFDAALEVFPTDTNAALWVSFNWLNDPLVVASKDTYAQNIDVKSNLLDKEQLSVKLLKLAEEKDPSGRFYICEAKDRLAAYKLYAEVAGYIGKIAIDASTNHFVNNELKLTLVKAVQKETVEIIEAEPDLEPTVLPLNLKLVNSR
jgi:hypothetical protein